MAGILRPQVDMMEGEWVVNSAYDSNGTNSKNDLFDGLRGTWDSLNTFYWNAVSTTYIDITLLEDSAIWVLPNPSYPTYNKGLLLSKWNGTSFDNVTVLPDRTTSNQWEKMIELEEGRYRFTCNALYRMDDEWFIESLMYKKLGLKSKENKYYGIDVIQKADGSNLATQNNIKSITTSSGSTTGIITNTGLGVNSGWSASSSPSGWVKFEFNSPTALDRFNICSYYGAGYEPIQNFSIEASQTGLFNGEQTILYEGTHPYQASVTYQSYTFNNSLQYRYYRINVKDIHYGNGANDLVIAHVTLHKDRSVVTLLDIPQLNKGNMEKYFNTSSIGASDIYYHKGYILQDTISENADGLWVQEIDRKPLSIKFE